MPSDSRAARRELAAGFVAFAIGFLAALIGYTVLLFHSSEPEQPWWEKLMNVITFLPIALLGGLGLACLVIGTLGRMHYRLGIYRCVHCGRPMRGIDIPCDCRQAEEQDA